MIPASSSFSLLLLLLRWPNGDNSQVSKNEMKKKIKRYRYQNIFCMYFKFVSFVTLFVPCVREHIVFPHLFLGFVYSSGSPGH